MTNIILCGGSGTRLWPISRTLMPKQFVQLFNDKSLFQLTVLRNQKACSSQMIVSNAEQYFLAVDQLARLHVTKNSFLLEPVGRNTAPAITLACMALDPDEIVLVTPSDHLIKDEKAYLEVLTSAKEQASQDNLVTFGIQPSYAETGFGYIEAAGLDVKSFKEKPDAKTAQQYIDAGNYYWNSGMFCFKAGLFLDELERYSPEIYHTAKIAYENALKDKVNSERREGGLGYDLIRIAHTDMAAIPEDSIDYAVMEKSSCVKVIPSDIAWSDLGSFDALYDELPKNGDGNTANTHHISIDSHNNLILAHKTIATIDIDDLIIIDTEDALLISKKGSSQKVKEVVSELKKRDSHLPNIHLTAHRPWGTYTVLEDTPGYKIKRIVVRPGKRLSLQKHFHRNEHWIVVSGTATVTVGENTFLVRPNESTYIKMGELHRLENTGKIDLVLIEAQVGEYTGEDDIVRIDDDFKRT
ncbi:MAG: mannose-1-phosphate guanylyltransferase/mannose-6-phosphate isomerase [Sulfuricurvum sp.]|nr:mannose-1-phosphate guanylyltransferase/mannose-6-phosphate isomerase [Sulfuricurvum sp.]